MKEQWIPTDHSDLRDPAVLDGASKAAHYFAEEYAKLDSDSLSVTARQERQTDLRLLASRVIDDVRVFHEISTGYDDEFAVLMANPYFKGMSTYYVLSEFSVGGTLMRNFYPGADLIGLGQEFLRVSLANEFPIPPEEKIKTDGIMAFQDPEFQESLFEADVSPQKYIETLKQFRDEQTKIALSGTQEN